jgi:hypothetical protein
MNKETKQWTWNDGWILMSVYLAQSKEEAILADVIAAADSTNHAIPTPNELTHAFTKLRNSGVLKIENDTYKISSQYLSDIENAYKTKGGLFETAINGQNWLNASGLKIVNTPKVKVTEEEVKKAYNVYNVYISNIRKKG